MSEKEVQLHEEEKVSRCGLPGEGGEKVWFREKGGG